MKGRDIIARDRTGSGKTLAFSLPVILRMRENRCFEKNHLVKFLIVLPTRELTMQVKDEIESLRFKD
jgi:superfamily II DNA/RNA helicase